MQNSEWAPLGTNPSGAFDQAQNRMVSLNGKLRPPIVAVPLSWSVPCYGMLKVGVGFAHAKPRPTITFSEWVASRLPAASVAA